MDITLTLEQLERIVAGSVGKQMRPRIVKNVMSNRAPVLRELRKRTPDDLGKLRASWSMDEAVDFGGPKSGVDIRNSAPYAGIVEVGTTSNAYFNSVNIEDLASWVSRHFPEAAGSPTISKHIAYNIVRYWKKNGRLGKRFTFQAIPDMAKLLNRFAEEAVHAYFQKGKR